jgi:ADP-ribose pyrophosphatase
MNLPEPQILDKCEEILSPWVRLVTRKVDFAIGAEPQIYHAFSQHDYVSILALTPENEVILVKQYRPACEDFTIEIPGGLLELDEQPILCARRELYEETGYKAENIHSFEPIFADTGRLSNYVHGFFTKGALIDRDTWSHEKGVSCFTVPLDDFRTMILDGRIGNSIHVAIAGQAMIAGLI